MDDLNPYPEGEWMKLDVKDNNLMSASFTSTAEGEAKPDKILRGPIWNYGKKRKGEKEYYDELLFGKPKNTSFAPDELILKGPTWAPAKPVKHSFAKYLFKKLRKVNPDSIALLEVETRRTMSYREVIETSKSVACGLRWAGVLPGHVVALVSFNSLEAYQVILGAFLAGAIPAMLDSSLNPADLATLFKTIQPRLIFTEGGKTMVKVELALSFLLVPRKPTVVVSTHNQSHPHFTFQQLLREVGSDFQPAHLLYNPDNPLMIMMTSGTTGTAKGAVIPERMYMNNRMFLDTVYSMSATPTTTLNSGPCSWSTVIGSLLIQLSQGNRVVFFRGPPSAAVLCVALRKYNVLVWVSGPATLMSMLHWPAKPRCTHLKIIFFTGMPILKSNIIKLQNDVFEGKILIIQLYGMTEIGVTTSNALGMNKTGSVGRVFFNNQLKVVQDETGLVLGPNEEGEICVGSNNIMLGYYNNPEATEACFDEEGFFCTGDNGYYDEDGFVFITGRKKDLIIWMSFQVAPVDVEAKLLAHPAVKEAVVVGLPDVTAGELVTAAVILHPDYQDTDLELLLQVVNDSLSTTKKIRGGIHIFSSFPLTVTGKSKRKAIKNVILSRKEDTLETIHN